MRTDELRRELHDLAGELDPFTGNAGRVRARVRRTRLATASALALLLVIGLGVGAALAGDRNDDDSGVAVGGAKAVDVDDLRERDALVIGAPDAGAGLQSLFDESDLVVNYVALRPGVASLFKGAFSPDINDVDACEFDSGFIVDLAGDAEIAPVQAMLPAGTAAYSWREVNSSGIVDVIIKGQSDQWTDGDTEIFMNVAADESQISAVQTQLEDDPDVSSVQFLSKEDAYAEFQRIFADQPDLIASTKAEDLPPSFRVTTARGANIDAVRARYGFLPGVNEVISARSTLC